MVAWLDVQIEGAGVSKIPSGLWLGIAGDGIYGHELIQEEEHVREGDKGLIFCI